MRNYVNKLLVSMLSLLLLTVQPIQIEAASNAVKPLQQLCIFYSWATYINGSNGIVDKAVKNYQKCNVVVFGNGLQHQNHTDHNNTKKMIPKLTAKGIEVYGYTTLGVSTVNLSKITLKKHVNEWKSMGVTGVFLDEAGYDYKVTRERQNEVIDYIHNSGLKVFVNAWNPDDVLSDKDDKGYKNPSHMKSADWFLLESWKMGQGEMEPLKNMVNRGQKAIYYKNQKKIRVAAVTTKNNPQNSDYKSTNYQTAWWSASAYGFDAFQWTDCNYSSDNSKLIFYPILNHNYGTVFLNKQPILKNGSYERYTNKGKISFGSAKAKFTPMQGMSFKF